MVKMCEGKFIPRRLIVAKENGRTQRGGKQQTSMGVNTGENIWQESLGRLYA